MRLNTRLYTSQINPITQKPCQFGGEEKALVRLRPAHMKPRRYRSIQGRAGLQEA
jgi:hypothetical protein